MYFSFRLRYDGADYNRWDKTFRVKLRKHLKKSGRRLATIGPQSLKTHIKEAYKFPSLYPENSLFYKASKKNRSVLYNVGFLKNAPRYNVNTHPGGDVFGSVDVGFLQNVVHPSGTTLYKIIGSIIKGGTWEPSDSQRKAYWAKMADAGVKDRNKATRSEQYYQPSRNFLDGFVASVNTTPIIAEAIEAATEDTGKAVRIRKMFKG